MSRSQNSPSDLPASKSLPFSGQKAPTIRVFLLASSLLLAACPLTGSIRPDQRKTEPAVQLKSKNEYQDALADYEAERWLEAERGFARFLTEYPDSSLAADARFMRGLSLNRSQEFEMARLVLRDFLERHPTSPRVHEATVELARAELALGNVHDARQILQPVAANLSEAEKEEFEELLQGLAASEERLEVLIEGAEKLAARQDAQSTREFARLLAGAKSSELDALVQRLGDSHPATILVDAARARLLYHQGKSRQAEELAESLVEQAQLAKDPAAQLALDSSRRLLERLSIHQRFDAQKVGVIIPLSGRFQGFGAAVKEGIELAFEGNTNLSLIYEDSAADPVLAVRAVEKLAREGVAVILGPVGVQEAGPAAARAQELGVPMILLSRGEGAAQIGPYIFQNALTSSAQGRALARFATEVLGKDRAAILSPKVPTGEEVSFAFWDELEAAGGQIRGFEQYPYGQTTFAPTIKRLVARDNLWERDEFRVEARKINENESDPYRRRRALDRLASEQPPIVDFDVLVLPDFYENVALVAPALAVEDVITSGCDEREMQRIRRTTGRERLNPVVLLGGAGWNHPQLVARAGRYVNCAVFVDGFYVNSERPNTQRFVQNFTRKYQRQPSFIQAQSYDSAAIIRRILEAQHPESRDEVRQSLVELEDFPGATGDTRFGPDGEAEKPLFFLKVDKNSIVELDVNISSATRRPASAPKSR